MQVCFLGSYLCNHGNSWSNSKNKIPEHSYIYWLMMLPHTPEDVLLLSCVSRVWLCATPYMAAHQAPLSLGFSRQEHWSGLLFPSPVHESEKWKWSCCCVWLFVTPWTAAYQASPSMGFSRQEYWSGVAIAFSIWRCETRQIRRTACVKLTGRFLVCTWHLTPLHNGWSHSSHVPMPPVLCEKHKLLRLKPPWVEASLEIL